MPKRVVAAVFMTFVFCAALLVPAFAEDAKPIKLPEPKLDASKSLAQALKDRKTTREYSTESLSDQQISNLLWSTFGINRADSGRRTAPSTLNWQEIEIYVANSSGIYLYDPKAHALIPKAMGDLRALTYTQVERFKDAPLNLVYVADLEKTGAGEEAPKMVLVGMDTGFVAENAYLYCASEGLNTGYRISVPKEKFAETLKLRPSQKVMGAQSVGLPKKK